MPTKMKRKFILFLIITIVGTVVILSISFTNYQKQSTMLREEIFDKCKMIAVELKHTREYLAETRSAKNFTMQQVIN